jgi:hypothetical protein
MRTIRESPEYTQACADMGVERMDEVLLGVHWGLAKNAEQPSIYPKVPGTGLRFASVDATPGVPEMRIYFTISDDDQYVDALLIERVDGDDPDDPVF